MFLAANVLVTNILVIKKIKFKENYAYSFQNIMLFISYYKLHQKQILIVKLD